MVVKFRPASIQVKYQMLQNLSFTTVFVLTVLNIELPRRNAVRFGRNVSLSNMLINVCKFLDHWAKVHHCDLFVVLSASLGENPRNCRWKGWTRHAGTLLHAQFPWVRISDHCWISPLIELWQQKKSVLFWIWQGFNDSQPWNQDQIIQRRWFVCLVVVESAGTKFESAVKWVSWKRLRIGRALEVLDMFCSHNQRHSLLV